jgi:hypothetical protein
MADIMYHHYQVKQTPEEKGMHHHPTLSEQRVHPSMEQPSASTMHVVQALPQQTNS